MNIDGWEGYLQTLPKEFYEILEDNFWEIVLK